MLTKLRSNVKCLTTPIAKFFVSCGFTPSTITLLGLVVAIPVPIIAYLELPLWLIPLLIFLSAFFDAIDGEVARITGKVSKLGAFMDSTIDRIEDSLYITTLIFLEFNIVLVITLLVASLMISYVRARAEGLGLKMEGVGIIERSERVIFLALITLTYIINKLASMIAFYVLIILSVITLVQRIAYVAKNVRM